MTQDSLLDWAPPHQRDSSTSTDAAESIRPSAARLRNLVLSWLREHGPATDEQMQEALALAGNCQRPRRRELQLAGLVEVHDEEGKTRSGRRATRWKVVKL